MQLPPPTFRPVEVHHVTHPLSLLKPSTAIRLNFQDYSLSKFLERSCTVTIEVQVGTSGTHVKATCAATAEDCNQALSMALNCAKAAMNEAKSLIP